ncbi:Hypothetical protein CINCED_3A003785 [Cinara cedri]|uniref:Cytochrome b561 domain-containing protein n=1 Tax=Cinara cedri TaxID=506608 RepID=A0A5E4MQ15_9HEMI|nr:Hypothetical protein CINCED_3A003785 [Cinara cedri]
MNVSKAGAISSVKDDTDDGVLELDNDKNSSVNNVENVTKSNNNPVQLLGNPTTAAANQNDNENENDWVGLCFWTIFQVVGLACVATIICRSVIYRKGYFEASSDYSTQLVSITVTQFSNWHYSLTTIGFIYLYANSMLMLQKNKNSDVTLQYVMLHTFAFAVSALALYAIYANKETNKPKDSKFYQGHLYSVHSWVGLCAALMFTVQWLSTVAAFVMPCLRNAGLPPGRTFSLYTVFVSSVALVTGINGHAIKLLKGAYRTYSTESLILNGFGMLVMVFLFLIAFMVLKPTRTLRMYVLHE